MEAGRDASACRLVGRPHPQTCIKCAAPRSLSTAAQVFPSYRESSTVRLEHDSCAACEASRLADDGEKHCERLRSAGRSLIHASVAAADNQPARAAASAVRAIAMIRRVVACCGRRGAPELVTKNRLSNPRQLKS